MKTRHTLLAAVSTVLFAVTSLTAADTINSKSMWVHETVTVQNKATVKITSEMGDVRIRTWHHDKVAIRSEAVHGTIVIDATNQDGIMNIDARSFGPIHPETAAVHTIYVPNTATIVLGTINGVVDIEDPEQTLTVQNAQTPPTL